MQLLHVVGAISSHIPFLPHSPLQIVRENKARARVFQLQNTEFRQGMTQDILLAWLDFQWLMLTGQ